MVFFFFFLIFPAFCRSSRCWPSTCWSIKQQLGKQGFDSVGFQMWRITFHHVLSSEKCLLNVSLTASEMLPFILLILQIISCDLTAGSAQVKWKWLWFRCTWVKNMIFKKPAAHFFSSFMTRSYFHPWFWGLMRLSLLQTLAFIFEIWFLCSLSFISLFSPCVIIFFWPQMSFGIALEE